MNVNDIIDGSAIEMVRAKFEETATAIWAKVYDNARRLAAEYDLSRQVAYERD